MAVVGLVLWNIYMAIDTTALAWVSAWVSFALLVVIALAGFFMTARWLPVYQGAAGTDNAPEKSFPVGVVGAHGPFAVAALVTVVLGAIGVGC